MRRKILFALLTMTSTAFADGKYISVSSEDIKSISSDIKTASATESVIRDHIIGELGEQSRYKTNPKRVLSISLIDQLAGPNEGKFLADINFITEPNMMGLINLDGLIIDVMRIAKVISQDKSVKLSKIAVIQLRPHIIPFGGGSPEQVAKFEIDLASLEEMSWGQTDGLRFENVLQKKGKISMSPYFLKNGGKFLILKKEQLDL